MLAFENIFTPFLISFGCNTRTPSDKDLKFMQIIGILAQILLFRRRENEFCTKN